jgi:hypothetical protein
MWNILLLSAFGLVLLGVCTALGYLGARKLGRMQAETSKLRRESADIRARTARLESLRRAREI